MIGVVDSTVLRRPSLPSIRQRFGELCLVRQDGLALGCSWIKGLRSPLLVPEPRLAVKQDPDLPPGRKWRIRVLDYLKFAGSLSVIVALDGLLSGSVAILCEELDGCRC
jgi:hypothetical protein